MNKKLLIITLIFFLIIIVLAVITNYVDTGRVTTGHEPKCCIKIVSNDGSKVTYWGLGYKVIRYVGVSPNELYENNIGVKMGSWFMKYELPEPDSTENKEYSFFGKVIESTANCIIVEPNEDEEERNGKIKVEMYKDGGSILYKYDNYAIIKCHTLEGNRDVYNGWDFIYSF